MLYPTQDKIWVRQQDDFKRMYPDKNINNGYVLWLNCKFFIPYKYENINPFFRLYNKRGEKLATPKYKLRKLFPNPNYLSICMKSGRKLSDLGVILYFDNFKQLTELSTIVFGFSSYVNNRQCKYYYWCKNKVSYKYSNSKRNYIISITASSLCKTDEIETSPLINRFFEDSTDIFGIAYKDVDNSYFKPIRGIKDISDEELEEILVDTLPFEDQLSVGIGIQDAFNPFFIDCLKNKYTLTPVLLE